MVYRFRHLLIIKDSNFNSRLYRFNLFRLHYLHCDQLYFFDVFVLSFSCNFKISLFIKFKFVWLLGCLFCLVRSILFVGVTLIQFILLVVVEFVYYFEWLSRFNVLHAQLVCLFKLFFIPYLVCLISVRVCLCIRFTLLVWFTLLHYDQRYVFAMTFNYIFKCVLSSRFVQVFVFGFLLML